MRRAGAVAGAVVILDLELLQIVTPRAIPVRGVNTLRLHLAVQVSTDDSQIVPVHFAVIARLAGARAAAVHIAGVVTVIIGISVTATKTAVAGEKPIVALIG